MYKVFMQSSDVSWDQFSGKVFATQQEAIDYLSKLGFTPWNMDIADGVKVKENELAFAYYGKTISNDPDFGAPEFFGYIFTVE